ncbi:MAG: zinc-binding dehydrogenase [Planctomycetes bacterium]|nr:zinc-binding dehydrogenase [Planctomycetota bacterium]
MRALELAAYDGRLRAVEKPVPRPGPGQVLVRIAAAPVNPSDLKFIVGAYGLRKPLPVVPGIEGSGTVVAAGPGLMARLQVGKRVACLAPESGDGTWAEYMVADARRCIPLRKELTLEQGAMMVVNPWTAWALVDVARRRGHRAAVHTAAAGALGRMLVRLGLRLGFPIIHIVRRAEQAEALRGLGARAVLVSSDGDFDARLAEACRTLGATVAFDAVAGEMTGRVLAAMPPGSTAIVYGSLSEGPVTANASQFIYEDKRIEGFWLSRWAAGRGLVGRARLAMGLQKHLATDFATEVRARVPLEQAAEAIEDYRRHMTGGKVLIIPGELEGS